MLFNSLHFLFFFPVVTAAYFMFPRAHRWWVLLVASFYFYMAWKPAFVLLILATVSIDYFVAMRIYASDDPVQRRRMLGLSIAANMAFLGVFKYANFGVDQVRWLSESLGMGIPVPVLNIILPIGISFHTFQSVAYAIDVYRGLLVPERNFLRFALFVMFYPQLVAGPIERAPHLLTQIQRPTDFDWDRLFDGLGRMAWGMFKKVVIADRLATYVNIVYADPDRFDGSALLIATYFFAFQIYADFSGYSDIALGAARVLGFELMENFRRPYFAQSIDEFWKRWHISLSTWFRDYLYIPLGGNRVSKPRWYANLMIVFLVSGLWHGANWTYLVWGALHGAYLVGALALAPLLPTLPRVARVLVTFHLALVAWVFFRAESVRDAAVILYRVAADVPTLLLSPPTIRGFYETVVATVTVTKFDFVTSFVLIAVLLAIDARDEQRGTAGAQIVDAPWGRRLWFDALVLACLMLGVFGKQQFIYFQF